MPKLLFFTYANNAYSLFALPYAFFALNANPNSRVEIILEDLELFIDEYGDGIKALEDIFPGQAVFRQSLTVKNKVKCKPHVVRFIEEPVTKSDYVYIGDIDVLIFEDILELHKGFMDEHNLPFSNIIRKGTESTQFPRLTGLHFCPFEKMYPLPDLEDINLNARNDENVLYEIMIRKGFMVPTHFRHRPLCGIHISLNRDSVGRYSVNRGDEYLIGDTFNWGVNRYKNSFLKLIKHKKFSGIFFYFSFEYRALLMVIEAVAKQEEKRLHRVAASFLVDKRLSSKVKGGKREELITAARNKLDKGCIDEAIQCLHNIVNVWPEDFNAYLLLGEGYLKLEDEVMGQECLLHALELTNALKHHNSIYTIAKQYNMILNS